MTRWFMEDGQTARQYCLKNGIAYYNVFKRLDAGYSMAESLKLGKEGMGNRHFNRLLFYKGKALVELFGLNTPQYQRVLKKIRKGMPIDEACKIEGL